MKTWQYNVLVTPVLLLVRVPILCFLDLVIRLGEVADRARDHAARLPAWRRQ